MVKRKPGASSGRFKQAAGVQSKQEQLVKAAYPDLRFKPDPLPYTQEHKYNPDFYLGRCKATGRDVYLELKEWMTVQDCAKYEAVVRDNHHVVIAFLIYNCPEACWYRLAKNPSFWCAQSWMQIPEDWWQRVGKADPHQAPPDDDHRPDAKTLRRLT